MSAQPVVSDVTPAARLRVVRGKAPTVSNRAFVVMIAILVVLGLAGIMIVTTQVGAQSKELASLRREATELGYTAASLTSELQQVSSANALALRASQLGMVPNPYPAFIHLSDGSVTGVPTKVTGNELPYLRGHRTSSAGSSGIVVAPAAETAPTTATDADQAATSGGTVESEEQLLAQGADNAMAATVGGR